MKKLYDDVRLILEEKPETRDNDKALVWEFYSRHNLLDQYGRLTFGMFISTNSPDSITRASRMVKHKHPELKGTKEIIVFKKKKEEEKGTFIFREQLSL